jgi:hypothetical protein
VSFREQGPLFSSMTLDRPLDTFLGAQLDLVLVPIAPLEVIVNQERSNVEV